MVAEERGGGRGQPDRAENGRKGIGDELGEGMESRRQQRHEHGRRAEQPPQGGLEEPAPQSERGYGGESRQEEDPAAGRPENVDGRKSRLEAAGKRRIRFVERWHAGEDHAGPPRDSRRAGGGDARPQKGVPESSLPTERHGPTGTGGRDQREADERHQQEKQERETERHRHRQAEEDQRRVGRIPAKDRRDSVGNSRRRDRRRPEERLRLLLETDSPPG